MARLLTILLAPKPLFQAIDVGLEQKQNTEPRELTSRAYLRARDASLRMFWLSCVKPELEFHWMHRTNWSLDGGHLASPLPARAIHEIEQRGKVGGCCSYKILLRFWKFKYLYQTN